MAKDLMGELKKVKLVEIDPVWSSRGRLTYDGIEDLAASIKGDGLITCLAVHSITGEAPYRLMAGGRRYKALEYLKLEEVNVRIYKEELTELELKVVELHENTKRKDVPHAEQVAMIRALNDAYISLNGEKIARTADATGHSMTETARLLGRSVGSVSQDIALAMAIENLPELNLGSAKNKSTAWAQLKNAKALLEAKVVVGRTSNPRRSINYVDTYIIGDFFDNKLPSEAFNFIEVDPPYAIDLNMVKKRASGDPDYNEITRDKYPEFLQKTCTECYRLAAPNSWIVLWHAQEWALIALQALIMGGFKPSHPSGIWYKINSAAQTNQPQQNLSNSYENFWYARKGEGRIRLQGRSNVFSYPAMSPSRKWHLTQRPAELIEDLLETFCMPSSEVLVPFGGSGQTVISAFRKGHRAIAFDSSDGYKDRFLAHLIQSEESKRT